MVTQIKIVLDDTQRRMLRVGLGHRGGMASRDEVKAIVQKLFADFLEKHSGIPESWARDKNPETSPLRLKETEKRVKLPSIHYQDVDGDVVCATCSHPKTAHGFLGYCPLDLGIEADNHTDTRFSLVSGVKVLHAPRAPKAKEEVDG